MLTIDTLLGTIAPHYCLTCGKEGSVVCAWCFPDFAPLVPSRCYLCRALTTDCKVCPSCRRKSMLKHVWVRTTYEGNAKQLVYDFKFERKQAAADTIAQFMQETLPHLPPETTIVHIPTATSRVRTRGYDHAELIARCLARRLGLEHRTLLARVTQTRQVGSKRAVRLQQMESAFAIQQKTYSHEKHVLLIDDLSTTGATLEAAARCLKQSGTKVVDAVVFAQK